MYESGTTSPLVLTPIAGQKEFPPQSSTPPVTTEPLLPTVVHSALYGKCRFISFPTLPLYEAPPPPPQGSFPLFIDQVLFETTTAELMWLFHRTCGACSITIKCRGIGCFILHLKSESERALVRHLHKRILFDIGGQAKLPRNSMVVEDIKVDSAEIPGYYPSYYPQGTPHSQSFAGHPNGWGSSGSTRGTPRGPMYGSKPPSPLMAPLTSTQAPTIMLSSNRASSTTMDFQ
ncbi:hypothetical protein LSM04_008806 [Trypanosoma melophagium]|uniref:uncharacterized protein n=1 Tax=Trypanosoma melophagium TaxID=715481 RepID=UPI00351A7322|nr:hypothetical protein LSM04_008806 [Trypanosoma melophagium]